MGNLIDDIVICFEDCDFEKRLGGLSKKRKPYGGRFGGYDSEPNKTIVKILRAVSEKGDEAVSKYTRKYDDVDLTADEFLISKEQLKKAHSEIDKGLLGSMRQAIEKVKKYQIEIFVGNDKTFHDGTGIRYTPLKRVGICVPGATAPLFSTVIMCAVPAQVAGVKQIVVVSPPRYNKSIHPVTLAVCYELGIDEVYRIGGAQAVGALAGGTETIRKVDKIVGPGNPWVQSAKKNVSGDYVGIDSVAGPSEVLIIANDKARPACVAADMLSQAEHALDSTAIMLTDSLETAQSVVGELKKQLVELSTAEAAKKSLIDFGGIVVFEKMNDVIEFANEFVAEHLHIQCGDKSKEVAERIENAGAIFIGDYSPVAVGDYWAGPSHTLPTGGTARFSSALTSNDFVKSISIIEYSREQLASDGADIIRLAEAEGLDAHAKSVRMRQEK